MVPMNDEQPLSLRDVACRYGVQRRVVIEWSMQGFIPKPDWINGKPFWWPGCLEAHDLIVWSNGGQPDLGKVNFQHINYFSNKRGIYPFAQLKKRGRPRKAA